MCPITSKYQQAHSTLTFSRICQTALFLHCELVIWFCTLTKITNVLILKQALLSLLLILISKLQQRLIFGRLGQ